MRRRITIVVLIGQVDDGGPEFGCAGAVVEGIQRPRELGEVPRDAAGIPAAWLVPRVLTAEEVPGDLEGRVSVNLVSRAATGPVGLIEDRQQHRLALQAE